jgi:transcriptional regulator with XRE-family HTH domain
MDILQLAGIFRAARINCRLTQQDVADGAGVSVVTVSRFERGELLEIGTVKLLNLFRLVGLELYPRPLGHVRTLDDIQRQRALSLADGPAYPRTIQEGGELDIEPQKSRRVRHAKTGNPHG